MFILDNHEDAYLLDILKQQIDFQRIDKYKDEDIKLMHIEANDLEAPSMSCT